MTNWLRTIAAIGGVLLADAAQAGGIGLSAPLSGPSAILGEQMQTGARAAAAATGVALEVADDACTAAGGADAARRFVEAEVSVVVGYLCTEAFEAALPILKEAGIPAITVGVRTDSLTDRREKTGWPVFRLGPRGDSEREAAARILSKLWRQDLFAIVDDGTIYGRELAETVRAAAEHAALKPVFVDTFRPQMDNQIALIGRLRKAGATHVFVGGDREDVAVMGHDAAQLGVPLTIASGETLRAAPDEMTVAEGTLMIAMPEWHVIAEPSVVNAIQDKGAVAEGYVLPAYAAVQVAAAAVEKAAAAGADVVRSLSEDRFETALGPVKFDSKGDLAQNPYRLFRFDHRRFVPMESQ
ncbi:ABC transporter substrate-binding protein [Arvimicrobium flavum]|uniref:ABC transporter substrate-binding protein n=1 Tax=Arvimicrobium flavum TaxID=3393320 RepID=UPI00237A8AF7|nr:ABC transporter substrate-binding protein [Mesorhizobium shangrilense]